ncbi:MbtH family protein [Streptomyces sp. NPDC088348]|uniref:MbtH family protein n=1 Tax=Streptomyces sp. NPDC088348 TaxID=3365853 RepID=UPI003816DB1B
MSNPFDDTDGTYLALCNDEGQHSLWPADLDVPEGWSTVHGPAVHASCEEYVEEHWVDMRPRSLVAAMDPPTR